MTKKSLTTAYARRDKLKVRQVAIKYKYGLDWEEYISLHEKANGCYEI